MATPRKTWREKTTSRVIMSKMNRRKNPVRSLVQLAEEVGAPVSGPYFHGERMTSGRSTSPSFRNHIKNTVGTHTYRMLRNFSQVRSH